MAMQAVDTFVATMKDGSERLVAKGEVLPDSHELVKRDQSGVLFRRLDLGEQRAARANSARRSAKG